MIKYIDISEHNGAVDFSALPDDIGGVMIRAGYGRGNIDKQFIRNISECNRLGIPCGAYWFSYACSEDDAVKEAEYCVTAVSPYVLELPIAFDWEYDSAAYATRQGKLPTQRFVTGMVKAFCAAVEAAGYYAMVYANPDYLSRYIVGCEAYDLWLANYADKPDRPCGIWQYGTEIINGVETDCNVSYKDYPEIIKKAGLNHLKESNAIRWAISKGIITDKDMEMMHKPVTLLDVIGIIHTMGELEK